jgi:hypothetical protein
MPLIEIDTFGAALKKYAVIYTLGVATGIGVGYKLFHENEKKIDNQYKIEIPYKK